MPTITLVQAAAQTAENIILMTAMPMNIDLINIAGGAVQFQCANPLNTIRNATAVQITYDGAHGGGHEEIQVSSVIA